MDSIDWLVVLHSVSSSNPFWTSTHICIDSSNVFQFYVPVLTADHYVALLIQYHYHGNHGCWWCSVALQLQTSFDLAFIASYYFPVVVVVLSLFGSVSMNITHCCFGIHNICQKEIGAGVVFNIKNPTTWPAFSVALCPNASFITKNLPCAWK